MSWSLSIQNQSSHSFVAPGKNVYYEGTQAVVFIEGLGSVTLMDVGHQPGGPHFWAIRVSSGSHSELWWYDGPGAPTLTILADGSFTVTDTFGQSIGWVIGGPKGTPIQLAPSQLVYLRAMTNAGYLQRVFLTINDGGFSFKWTGSGENNAVMADLSTTTPAGNGKAYLSMEHSSNQGQSWVESLYAQTGSVSIMGYRAQIQVSEDATDNDYNDCAVTLQWWERPPEHMRNLVEPDI